MLTSPIIALEILRTKWKLFIHRITSKMTTREFIRKVLSRDIVDIEK